MFLLDFFNFNFLFLTGYNYSIDSNFFLLSLIFIIIFIIIYLVTGAMISYNNGNNNLLPKYADFPDRNLPNEDSWWRDCLKEMKIFCEEYKTPIIFGTIIIVAGGIIMWYASTKSGTPPPFDGGGENVDVVDIDLLDNDQSKELQSAVNVQRENDFYGNVDSNVYNFNNNQFVANNNTTLVLNNLKIINNSNECLEYFNKYYNLHILTNFDQVEHFNITNILLKIRRDCLNLPCISEEQYNIRRLEVLNLFLDSYKSYLQQKFPQINLDFFFEAIKKILLTERFISKEFFEEKYLPFFQKLLNSSLIKIFYKNLEFKDKFFFNNLDYFKKFIFTFLPSSKNYENNFFYTLEIEEKACLFRLNIIRENIIINKKFDLMGCIDFIMNMHSNKEYKQVVFKNYFLPVIINDVCLINNCNFLNKKDVNFLQSILLGIEVCDVKGFFDPVQKKRMSILISILLKIQKNNPNFIEPLNLKEIDDFIEYFYKE